MIKNTYLLVLLLVFCIMVGCQNKMDSISKSKEISVNYQLRNKVFEKYAFEKNEFERIKIINSGNEVFLNSERNNVNPFSFSDSDIKKSNIKSLEEIEYKFVFGKKEDMGVKKYLLNYNKSGKSIEENTFGIAHDIKYEYYPARIKYVYEQDSILKNISIFNPDNYRISGIKFDYDGNFNLITKTKNNINDESIPNIKDNKNIKRNLFLPKWRKSSRIRPTAYGMYILLKGKDFNSTFKNDIIDPDFNFSYRYDNNNKKVELIEWFKSGSIHKKEIYSYDSLGNIKEVNYYDWNYNINKVDKVKYVTFLNDKFEIFEYDTEGKINNQITYMFDSNFNLSEILESHKNEIVNWKISYIYNAKNKETKRFFYKGEQLDRKIISDYNENDQLLNKKIFSDDSTIVYKIKYSYNNIGLVSEETILNNRDEQIVKTVFKYNEKNDIQEFTEYDNLNEPLKTTAFLYEYYD